MDCDEWTAEAAFELDCLRSAEGAGSPARRTSTPYDNKDDDGADGLWDESLSLEELERELGAVCPAEWEGHEIPDREWWIDGLIPSRTVTILSGDGGVGKSLLALQLSMAGSLRTETIGFRPAPGRALYIGAEDEAEEFHRRKTDICRMLGKTLGHLTDFRLIPLAGLDAVLALPDARGQMAETALMQKIKAYAARFMPRVIMLDTSADLFGGDEVKRVQVRQFVGMLREIAIKLDCAVVLLSHPSQTGMQLGTGSSGSTAWNNSVRSRLYLTKPDAKDCADPDVRLLKTMKANYGKTGSEWHLRWKAGAFVKDRSSGGGSEADKARAERLFIEALSGLNEDGGRAAQTKGSNYAPGLLELRPEAQGLSERALEDAMKRLLRSGEIVTIIVGPPSKQRQKLVAKADKGKYERDE